MCSSDLHGGEKLSAPLPPVPIEAVVPVHSAPPPLHPAAGRLLVPLKMRFSLPFMGDSSFSSAAPAGRLGIRLCSGRIGQACSGYAGRGAARNGVLTAVVFRKICGAVERGRPPRYGVLMGMGQAVTASRAALASSTRASICSWKPLAW